MDALATIAVEIQATMTAVFVVALIVILQILDLQRAKLNHKLKMRELSDSSQYEEYRPSASSKKYRLVSAFSLFLQFIFGSIVLVIFSCWALYLVQAGYEISAVVSGITAIVGIALPFVVWITSMRKNKEMAGLVQDLERRPKIPAQSEAKPVVQASDVVAAEIKETVPKPVESPKPISEAPPVVMPEPAVSVFDLSEKIPEDSMLRRHYLAHIESKKQSCVPTRPTDSMLRRHYDALMASLKPPVSKPEPVLPTVMEPVLEVAPVQARPCVPKGRMPQDSMLRRHYLSTLCSRLESALPPCPTDSMLKRHFEGWKHEWLDRELNKCLRGMES